MKCCSFFSRTFQKYAFCKILFGGCSHYMLIVKCCSFFSVLFRNTHCAKYYLVAAPIICYLWNTKCLENYWTAEAVVRRRFVKKVFLKISKNSQENTCVRVPFLENFQVKDCNVIKKRLEHRCFPVKYRHSFHRTSPVKLKVHKQRVLLQIIYYYTTGCLLNKAMFLFEIKQKVHISIVC